MKLSYESIDSTVIVSVGYDEDAEVLEIAFHNGHVYRYSDVPWTIYQQLMTADSKGAFFNHAIAGGGYPYQQIKS